MCLPLTSCPLPRAIACFNLVLAAAPLVMQMSFLTRALQHLQNTDTRANKEVMPICECESVSVLYAGNITSDLHNKLIGQ